MLRRRPCRASASSCSCAVVAAESHGVAMTTSRSRPQRCCRRTCSRSASSGHCSTRWSTRLHRPVLRPRADDDLVADAGEPGGEAAAGGARPAEDADAHGAKPRCEPARRSDDPIWHGERSRRRVVEATIGTASVQRLRRPRSTVAAMGLLDGKNIVVTGVLTDASLAYAVARAGPAPRAPRSCSPAPDVASASPSARPASSAATSRCSSSTSPCPSTSPRSATR